MNDNHLNQFNGKCSVLVSEDTYNRRMDGKPIIGYPPDQNNVNGSMYVSTSDDIDKALKDCNGDISKLESSLGFPQGYFGEGPVVRVDINSPEEQGLRLANGKEPGSNEFYNTKVDDNGALPNIQYTKTSDGRRAVDTEKTDPQELSKLNGQYIDQNGTYHAPNSKGYDGKTSGGLNEAVVNQIPNTPENISYTKIDGFKRGESSDIFSSKIDNGYAQNETNGKDSTNVESYGGGARAPNKEQSISNSNSQASCQSPNDAPKTTSPQQLTSDASDKNANIESNGLNNNVQNPDTDKNTGKATQAHAELSSESGKIEFCKGDSPISDDKSQDKNKNDGAFEDGNNNSGKLDFNKKSEGQSEDATPSGGITR